MSELSWFRFGFIVLAVALGLALLLRGKRTLAFFKSFFSAEKSASGLALLRILTFYHIYEAASRYRASYFAGLPKWMLAYPPGWSIFEGLVPPSPDTVLVLERILVVSSLFATIGLWGRYAVPIAGLLAPFIFGIPNLYGKVNHGGHLLVLWGLILAVSPASDAFSVDSLIRRLRGATKPPMAASYGAPVRFAWLVMALSYFFPGMWKLWLAGDLYADGRRLKSEMFKKWAAREDFIPAVRIDDFDWLLGALGAWTIIVEMGALAAIFFPWARVFAATQLVGFHVGVRYTLGIRFNAYLPLALLLDTPDIVRAVKPLDRFATRFSQAWDAKVKSISDRYKIAARWPASAVKPRSMAGITVVGSLLAAGMLFTGFGDIDTQPVSVYPTFASRATRIAKRGYGERLVLVRASGEEEDVTKGIRMPKARRDAWMRRIQKLHRKKKKNPLARELSNFARHLRTQGAPVQPGDKLTIYRRSWPADPAKREGRIREQKVTQLQF